MELTWQEKIQNRQDANLKIIEILKQQIEENPSLRFNQLLWATGIFRRTEHGIEDTFYEESVDTLEKLMNR